ncbi:GH20602 [Drosophila grimshawi]|uniref:GH20602 n=1 Tax=Drosophila grimshawi TaxID=7222 RepID=B4JRF3_DROGR|nr:GH20602 [Drosophila grimshawi]
MTISVGIYREICVVTLTPTCLDAVEVFPYLREPVIENSTLPAYTWCQHSARNATPIYSAGRLLGLRLRFQQPPTKLAGWPLNLTATYRFLKQENFKTNGRLVPHSFCDFYFFASTGHDGNLGQGYFHSPRFPAHYPAHIKCAYKFIGRPDSRVELLFEELRLPPVATGGCQLDALTIFDAESAHMNAVIDVLCSPRPTRRILSSGPDLLLEFNASSNRTAKGFRGKYKFVPNEQSSPVAPVLEAASIASISVKQPPVRANSLQEEAKDVRPGRTNRKLAPNKLVIDSDSYPRIQSNYANRHQMAANFFYYGVAIAAIAKWQLPSVTAGKPRPPIRSGCGQLSWSVGGLEVWEWFSLFNYQCLVCFELSTSSNGVLCVVTCALFESRPLANVDSPILCRTFHWQCVFFLCGI